MNSIDLRQLSKSVSHALRHEPQVYNLTLDAHGWVSLSDLVLAFNSKGIYVDEDSIVDMVEHSDKRRHQIVSGRIRACYGHSVEYSILKNPDVPPDFLYHGTTQDNLSSIIKKGLLPMERKYVHLSFDEKYAEVSGSRRKGELVILKVKSREAHLDHVKFYEEENGVWLSTTIPSKYIEIQWN